MVYKIHFFELKIFFKIRVSYMPYVGLKFVIAETNTLGTPISLDFRVTFIYLLSLFKIYNTF